MFQIVQISPTLCPHTDAIIGQHATRMPMAYHHRALAEKLAARHDEECFATGGDCAFRVVGVNEPAFSRRLGVMSPTIGDDLPW